MTKRKLLSLAIVSGSLLRLILPFVANPLDHIETDMYRHYHNATDPLAFEIFNLTDQVGYQAWLAAVLRLTGGARWALALYAGCLSVVTPWFWYRWMRESVPERALEGYAILAWLPDWIKVESLFMQETLFLPLLGLALWLSWRAFRDPQLVCAAAASLAWGGALVTKASAIPPFLIVWFWLFGSLVARRGVRGLVQMTLLSALSLSMYGLTALKIYCLTGVVAPQHMLYDEIYTGSGAQDCEVVANFGSGPLQRSIKMHFGTPSAYLPQLTPLSDWRSARQGTTHVVMYDLEVPLRIYPDFRARLYWTGENAVFFLFGKSWPGHVFVSEIGENVRWVWAPIALWIAISAIRRRRRDILTVLCMGTLAVYLLQFSFPLEGRHRMPLEGIELAAFLSLLSKSGDVVEMEIGSNVGAGGAAEG